MDWLIIKDKVSVLHSEKLPVYDMLVNSSLRGMAVLVGRAK